MERPGCLRDPSQHGAGRVKLDAATRRVLTALVQDPDADLACLAASAEVSPDVARERLDRLKRTGVYLGRKVSIDAGNVGFPYEALALAQPTEKTSRDALECLAASPRVTRMFTLASEHSICFTILGKSTTDVQARALSLAEQAGLRNLSITMLVETLADDPARGMHRAMNDAIAP